MPCSPSASQDALTRTKVGFGLAEQGSDLLVVDTEGGEFLLDIPQIVHARAGKARAGGDVFNLLFACEIGVDHLGVVIGDEGESLDPALGRVRFDEDGRSFANVNTPEDLSRQQKGAGE